MGGGQEADLSAGADPAYYGVGDGLAGSETLMGRRNSPPP